MAAQVAVDSGQRIWLKTEVFYQNDGADANDFTNVVPQPHENGMGPDAHGKQHRLAPFCTFNPLEAPVKRGPAQALAWDTPIDQPARAMFQKASNQEKAQAFEVINGVLKKNAI